MSGGLGRDGKVRTGGGDATVVDATDLVPFRPNPCPSDATVLAAVATVAHLLRGTGEDHTGRAARAVAASGGDSVSTAELRAS